MSGEFKLDVVYVETEDDPNGVYEVLGPWVRDKLAEWIDKGWLVIEENEDGKFWRWIDDDDEAGT